MKCTYKEIVEVCLCGLRDINNFCWYASDDRASRAAINNKISDLRKTVQDMLENRIDEYNEN